ncbi:MAG: pilus assembly protein N-terminal domain-containing protein, partial [Polyangiales bacterium]
QDDVQEADAARQDKRLELTVGEQRSLNAQGVRSYSESIQGVVDIRLTQDATSFLIVGKKAGTTSLLLIMMDGRRVTYRIRVKEAGAEGLQIDKQDNIRLDLYFVQVQEDYSHQLGVSWPSSVSAGTAALQFDFLAGAMQSATASVSDQMLPRLDMAQSDGWVKIERHSALITANGKEASFSSGGEVNIGVQGALTAEIRRISFGSVIKVLPRFDSDSGRIELEVKTDVSELTNASESGIPGRTVSVLDTVVNLELGQALMLGGLDAELETRNKTGLPWLSQIPILGGLFGSGAKRKSATKNMVVIVPTVIDPVLGDRRDLIREALALYEDFSGDTRKAGDLPRPQVRRGGRSAPLSRRSTKQR